MTLCIRQRGSVQPLLNSLKFQALQCFLSSARGNACNPAQHHSARLLPLNNKATRGHAGAWQEVIVRQGALTNCLLEEQFARLRISRPYVR
jgi:hypothetical protein